MKKQQKLWNRFMDALLPKTERKQPVMELYRSRALVRTALLGALLNPFLFLFETSAFDLTERIGIVLGLVLIPLALIGLFRMTGSLRLCGGLYMLFCTVLSSWAQIAAGTVHALYWIWVPFHIVFSVLILGVRFTAVYTLFVTAFFAWILWDSAQQGHTVGRFQDWRGLFASTMLQVIAIQFCFFLLMIAYDVIRNRAEVRAVLLRLTDDEAARLATVGERMGTMAQDLQSELTQVRRQLEQLDALARRSDTKVADVQTAMRELQERTRKLSEISQRAHG